MALVNFSGIASGIDSSSLIKTLLDQQRKARVKPLELKITELEDTNSAFGELSTLLSKLDTAASKLRALNGGAISKSASSSDETAVTASASSSASNGIYNLTVTSTARTATFSFDDRFASEDTVLDASINDAASASDRTFSLTTGQGSNAETVSIEITSSTTAGELVDQYNSQASKSVASLVNVGTESSPSYAITITSLNEGTERGTIADPVLGAELTGVLQSFSRDQATDAQFTVSGISGTITRSDNSVSDVVNGVTFELRSAGAAQIAVNNDEAETIQTIQDLVDAYNAVVNFVKKNDTVTRQEDGEEVTNIFGPLAKTSVDDNLLSALRSAFGSSSISGQAVNTLADLGITTQRDGTLALDTDALTEALDSDPESARTIFENLGESLSAVDGTIAQFNRFNGLIDQAEQANSTQISDINRRIADTEKILERQELTLTSQFAKLEGLIGRLNAQQTSLAQLL